jgi:hypothetical protein
MRTRAILAATTLVAAAIAVPATTAAIQSCQDVVVSGTIRWQNSSTWVVIEDSTHHSNGIASIDVKKDRLRINLSFTAATIGSVQVTPDERFAASSVRVGASVALSFIDVFFYMPKYGTTPVSPAKLTSANANVWISGWFDQSCIFNVPPEPSTTPTPPAETPVPTETPTPEPATPTPTPAPTPEPTPTPTSVGVEGG